MREGSKAKRIFCVNNLENIGTAYRIWANDNGDRLPSEMSQTNGGCKELLDSQNSGTYAWMNYLVMSNQCGQSSKILICPADERKAANDFTRLANTNISYFIGIGANDSHPQALLGGDRNLGPGQTPQDDYGFSPADGKGNDVTTKGPVCWSLKMHSGGNSTPSGNILMGDGSVQQVTTGNLNLNWLKPAMGAYTNLATGQVISNELRLIFP
jgi:prepilin-type processing-associated H-X9-DG protein